MAEALRILIVDDDDVDRVAVRRSLKRAGFDVEAAEAASAAAAAEQLRQGRFDCVFLDYNLPDGTGLELLQRIGAITERTPVIILTGQGDEQLAVELMKAGAADYIPKSALSPDLLRQNLPAVIRAFRAERELRETEERLRLAVESAEIGTWDLDLLSGEIRWSQRIREILGLDADTPARQEALYTLVHPDDRPMVEDAVQRALAERSTGFRSEYRVICPDGELRWVRATGRVVVANTRPIRFIGTLMDITAERQAAADLEEAVHIRDEVLAIVSHDLRNPLNTVLACASLLTDLPLSPEQVQKQIEIIKRTGHQMNRLLQDLLDVSRIEAGRLWVETTPFDPAPLLLETCALFEQQAATRQQTLVCEPEEGISPVQADRERISQIFSNLVSNAIRYTPEGGQIVLRARNADAFVEFSVADNGPGIPPDELPHIFERFWQARRARRMGAGLGLAIVKGIVEAHDGTLQVESQPGAGTTFTFRIPAAAIPVPA